MKRIEWMSIFCGFPKLPFNHVWHGIGKQKKNCSSLEQPRCIFIRLDELDKVSKKKGVKMPCPVPDRVKSAAYFVGITQPYFVAHMILNFHQVWPQYLQNRFWRLPLIDWNFNVDWKMKLSPNLISSLSMVTSKIHFGGCQW